MNYRKRKMLAGTLAVVLAMSSVLGLSVPLPVKATSDASVTYRYKNNAESGPVKGSGVVVNMPPCHGGDRGFESHLDRHLEIEVIFG